MYKTQNGWTKEKMKAQVRLKNNGKQSSTGSGYCQYRGDDNNACAAGCFIPDELYDPEMESVAIKMALKPNDAPSSSMQKGALALSKVKWPISIEGINKMQRLHDDSRHGTGWQGDMRELLCEWIDENVVDSEVGNAKESN